MTSLILVRLSRVALAGVLLADASAQIGSLEVSARSVLNAKCVVCHGPTRMSDLDLRDRESAMAGGKRGPAIVPGKAAESLLYKAVKRDGDLLMPPGKTPLTPAEVKILGDWINGGARWDSTVKQAESNWWSFKKVVRPALPHVKNTSAVQNPIDNFIVAKLEEKGLPPAAPADRQTLGAHDSGARSAIASLPAI